MTSEGAPCRFDGSDVMTTTMDVDNNNSDGRPMMCDNDDSTTNQLATETCRIMEEGGDDCVAKLFSVLGVVVVTAADDDDNDAAAISSATATTFDNANDTDDGSNNNNNNNNSVISKCHQVLDIFYVLIGHSRSHRRQRQQCTYNRLNIPLSIKAHLLLRALLQLPLHDDARYSAISWEAATAAIHSLQYYPSSSTSSSSILSHGEEVAMMVEIRSFITKTTTAAALKFTTNSKDSSLGILISDKTMVVVKQTIQQLHLLSNNIIKPLLYERDDKQQQQQQRRNTTYLRPLDLLPIILNTIDTLDDIMHTTMLSTDGDDDDSNRVTTSSNEKKEEIEEEEEEEMNGESSVVMNYLRKYGLDDAANELQTILLKNSNNTNHNDKAAATTTPALDLDDVEVRKRGNKDKSITPYITTAIDDDDDDDDQRMYIRSSDRLLSTMFGSNIYNDSNCIDDNLQNTANKSKTIIRADAILPLLSMAMDDIGYCRMMSTITTMSTGGGVGGGTPAIISTTTATYWDQLKYAICTTLRANRICYSIKNNDDDDDDELQEQQQQQQQDIIFNEALIDEGIHIIPVSDYPALTRCVFRMVTASSCSSNISSSKNSASQHVSSSITSWEAIFLQLYYAATVATIETPLSFIIQRGDRSMNRLFGRDAVSDRQALLCTIESHVLLPLCTGASVSTITTLLDACIQESCVYCKNDCFTTTATAKCKEEEVLPAWAMARIVLFVIGARASNISHFTSTTNTNFGPRGVFRMASNFLLKLQDSNSVTTTKKTNSRGIGVGNTDEIGYALKVLLHLSAVRNGMCRDCRHDNINVQSDKAACDLLQYSYYAGKGQFNHRYGFSGQRKEEKSYPHEQYGIETITSYTYLVRSSLGTSSKELYREDTARTWIDAANMLLDECFCHPPPKASMSIFSGGTAMAVIIIVTIFFEVPSSQNEIVRSIYDRFTNMTDTSKNMDESYFLVISILAWSLAADDRNYQNVDIVRSDRGRLMRGNETTVLEPLCKLLSKSSLTHDQQLNNDGSDKGPNLSYWTLHKLAHALSPISSGRDAILAIAQQSISTSSHQPNETIPFESLTKPTTSIDSICLGIDCLCVLIEKKHPANKSGMDEFGQKALGMLTDVMISWHPLISASSYGIQPRLTINIVCWMMSELNKATQMRKLTKWVSRRLLRACYAGLLKFIALEESDAGDYSSCFIPELIFSKAVSTRNDVCAMLRLAVLLFDEIAKSDVDTAPLLLESHTLLRPHIIRTLHHDHDIEPLMEDVTSQNAIDELFREGYCALRREFKPCDDSTDFAVDGVLLTIVFQAAAGMIHKKRISSPAIVDADAFMCLNEYIYGAERFTSLSSWLDAKLPAQNIARRCMSTEGLLPDCVEFKVSLCDIMAEILLREPAINRHDASILLTVNSLIGFKRSVDSSIAFANMHHSSINNLLELSSRQLRPLLRTAENKKDVLSEVDGLVSNVLDFCKISLLDKAIRYDLLTSVWSLYCSLVDEESSRLLITFVDESYKELGYWAESDETSVSLLSIASIGDIDTYVRHMRGTILSALSHILASIATSQNMRTFEELKSSLDLLLLILLQVCQDLDASFDGYSGGINKSLFLSFLGVIDACADAINTLFESMPIQCKYQITTSFASVAQASVIIWELFCEQNTLRQPSVVVGTLKICIDKIPSIIDKVERVVGQCVVSKSSSAHLCEILHQCTAQLVPKLRNGVDNTPPCVKKSHSLTTSISDEVATVSDRFEAVFAEKQVSPTTEVHSDRKNADADGVRPPKSELGQVLMPTLTRKTLMSVYNIAIGSSANIWNESYRIIIAGSGNNKFHMMIQIPTADEALALASRRIVDFANLQTSLCCMFAVRSDQKNIDMKHAETDVSIDTMVLAEILSYQQKAKLCSCIEKMAITLTLALKQMIKYFKESSSIFCQKYPFNQIKLKESLICILGFLHSINSSDMKSSLFAGFMRWRANEERAFSLSLYENDKDDDNGSGYAILGRLPKVLLRLEGLVAGLRELNSLINSTRRHDDIVTERTLILEESVSTLMNGSMALVELDDFRGMLRCCIETLDEGEDEHISNGVDDVLLSTEDEFDKKFEDEHMPSLSGKRQMRRLYPLIRKSRRITLRSRNETVDDWLTMDDDDHGRATGEKYNYNDAFVDLEDFLVEG